MKKLLVVITFIGIFFSCQQKKETTSPSKKLHYLLKKPILSDKRDLKNTLYNIKVLNKRFAAIDSFLLMNPAHRDTLENMSWSLCLQYSDLLSYKDTLESPKIDSLQKVLFSDGKNTTQNQKFVNAILQLEERSMLTTIEKPIAPIFNLKKDSVLIYNASNRSFGDNYLYEKLGAHSFQKKNTYVYTKNNRFPAQIIDFGFESSDCGEYFYYSIQQNSTLTKQQSFLFASPFKLELIPFQDSTIDSIINQKNTLYCLDCPSDWDSQQVFAKLKGFDDLYFSYSFKTGKKIDDLDTPMRAIYYVKNDFVFSLWSDEIDLFGCSCL